MTSRPSKLRVLKGAAVDVGDISEERGRRREKRRGGSGGRCRRRRRRRWRMAGLRLRTVRRTVGVYAAVMETHAAHQKILFDGSLMTQLLQSQLILPFPLRPATKSSSAKLSLSLPPFFSLSPCPTIKFPLPSILIPGLHLSLRERQSVRNVAAVRHAEILLTAKLPFEVSQLSVSEGGSSSPWFPTGRRCTVNDHPARLSRHGCRTGRRRERRRRTS